MNPIQFFEYGRKKGQAPNTFIGGVSATINTAQLLADKLQNYPSGSAFSASNIQNFTIVGNDVECYIGVDYTVNLGGNTSLIGYRETEPKLRGFYFVGCTNLTGDLIFKGITELDGAGAGNRRMQSIQSAIINLENCTSIGDYVFYQKTTINGVYYLPKLLTLGNTLNSENQFTFSGFTNSIIYVPIALQTVNAGSPDGDLTTAVSNGATIRYIPNFTASNPITNLSVGNVYGSAIQLIFTPPSSTNTIDYYNVKVDGVVVKKITGSGQYIDGLNLTTTYSIEVVPVDIYFNKSTSNIISQTTSSTYIIPTANLVSYYKLNEVSGTVAVDSVNSENLTLTNLTLNQTGLVDKSMLSTVASSRAKTTAAATSINGNFSLSILCYRTANGTGGNNVVADQGDYGSNSGFGIWMNASGVLSWRINQNFNHYVAAATLPLNQWVLVTLVYNGVTIKIYMDTVEKISAAITTNPNPSNSRTLFNRGASIESFIGKEEAVGFWNLALNQGQISEINSKLKSGQHLI
jgi:hypothetical protein